MTDSATLDSIVNGSHSDPFAILGVQGKGKSRLVRAYLPGVVSVGLINSNGQEVAVLEKVHAGGIFESAMPARLRRYRFRAVFETGQEIEVEDPFRFPSTLGELDLYLLGEGSDRMAYAKLGAHVLSVQGVSGTRFAVWAPNASRVSVIGDFNHWDGRVHGMRLHPGNGIWEIFLPNVGHGSHYKFEIKDASGNLLPLKSDPYGACHEGAPGNASHRVRQ